MSTTTQQGVVPTTLDRIDADAIESAAEREAVEALRHTADTGCQYSSLLAELSLPFTADWVSIRFPIRTNTERVSPHQTESNV